jgi:hypothetical protein
MPKILASFSVLFCLIGCSSYIFAQSGIVSGIVTHKEGQLEGVSVTVFTSNDSTWIKTVITNNNGAYELPELPYGNYKLLFALQGFEPQQIPFSLRNPAMNIGITELRANLQELNTITISGKRPFIESKQGKIVVNVENSSTAAGTNVLDLMRRLPGVNVGQDGSISLNGKQGVQVMIDDKTTYLSGEQLAAYLQTITADETAQIELMSQPGSRYDAAGNTGIINIKMRKSRKPGINGNASLTYRQGIYAYNQGSLLLNINKQRFNFNVNASGMAAAGFAKWKEAQRQTDPQTGGTIATSTIISNPVEHFSVSSLRLGCDYTAGENNTIGLSIRGTYHPNNMTGLINTARKNNTTGEQTNSKTVTKEGFIREDITLNAYWSHKFGTNKTLDINADALAYNSAPWQEIYSIIYNHNNLPTGNPLQLQSKQPNNINIYSLKADYTSPWIRNTTIEAGIKTSIVHTDNDSRFMLYENNEWINDTSRTNHFGYREQINAAYIGIAKPMGTKWETKIGLRAEQTIAKGRQYTGNSGFDRDYLSIFPTGYITYKVDTFNQLELNYGRRIDRPEYKSLNPFTYYSFQYSYTVGNPNLMPEYTHKIELKHNYKNTLITTIEYSATNGIINDVLMVNSTTNVVYKTKKNLSQNNSINCSALLIKDICNWWSVNLSGSLFYNNYSGFVNNGYRKNDGLGGYLSINNRLDLGKGWKWETNIYYSNSYVSSIIETTGNQVYTETGISKKIRNKLDLKIMANDPFGWYKTDLTNRLNGFETQAEYRNGTQQAGIALNYSFGNSQINSRTAQRIEECRRLKMD